MSIVGEDNEIILNASLSNSPNNSDAIAESSRVFLEKILVSMSSNAVKSGIDDIAARLKQNGTSSSSTHNTSKSNGSATTSTHNAGIDPTTISNHTPTMQLSCVECGVTKANSEEMEIHIKTEHLNWLPFQCPMCLTERASDSQMREHLHSSHQKNMSKFIYVDNVTAKRKLQVLMDKAFSLNVAKRVNASANNIPSSSTATSPYSPPSYRGMNSTPSSGRNTSTSNGSATSAATASAQAAATAIVNHHKEKEKQTAQAAADFLKLLDFSVINGETVEQKPQTPSASRTTSGRKRPYVPTSATEAITTMELEPSNAESFLATLNSLSHAQTPENEENDQPPFSLDDLNIDSSSTLATLFGGGAKKVKYEESDGPNDMMEDALDALNPISVLDNVAALFGSTPDRSTETEGTKKTSSISKKRVLGECSKCQKPVTAGARQMHMFFHLAKDEMIFRFRCKHEGCAIEHYRKDQMENHQSKAHGRIDPDMMEDRSLELFQKCQELNHELFVAHRHGHRGSPHQWSGGSADMTGYQDLSMELLGTKNGTIPGPTAAKAEIAYAAQQAANAQKNAQKSKLASGSSSTTGGPSSGSNVYTGFGPLKLVPDEDHPLQCRLCGKTMQNRIRGFHILWHMAKDKGINRYTCKYCPFGHDRSQSVQVHGKKEHGTDDCVEDRIGEYQDDVKEMSAACFGISSLFAQESKRKNKFPAAAPREHKNLASIVSSAEASPLVIMDEDASNDSLIKQEEIDEDEKPLLLIDDEMIEDMGEDEEVEHDQEQELEQEHEQELEHEHDVEPEIEEDDGEEDGEEGEEEAPVTSSSKSSSSKKKWRRAFNIRSKKSKKQKEDAVVARSVSILIGGAQFYKKKVNEFCYCEKCGKQTNSRLPEHAYTHMEGVSLYSCPACSFGNQCKDTVMKHMKETHPGCAERCVDNRLGHIKEIKSQLGECFPAFFVDHPLPTRADIEKLQVLASGGDLKIGGIEDYLKEECNGEESSAAPDEEEDLEEEDDEAVTSE
ncbi:CRE-ZTF-12 protein [Caenorhabditis remanei]|uniref:CRE-ZTF-12 protein n=1 Tax=Caenorhabditis remanei TaxID=31234 RepID=E3M068_CAERE|nr:CRE-ZTF-12 protein [Caenorhabditis remanei]